MRLPIFGETNKLYILIACAALTCGCNSHSGHDHEGDDHDHDTEMHSDGDHDHEGHNHEGHGDEIILEPERAEQLGIAVQTVEIQPIAAVLHTTGEVISDPASTAVLVAPSAGRIKYASGIASGSNVRKGQSIASVSASDITGGDENNAARIRLEAAKRELDRLTPLRESGIITAAEYNAAREAYDLAKNSMGSGNSGVVSPIAGVLTGFDVANGQYVAAGDPVATVAANGEMVIRADVPKRHYEALRGLTGAKATCSHHHGEAFDIALSSKPVASASDRGYQPVYFTIGADSDLHPGDLVELYLSGQAGREGIMIPTEALVERFGRKFVYVQLDEEGYERRPVDTGVITADMTEITSGLAPGDKVVTKGVTFVRLAENSSVIPEGHHHH